MLWLFLPFVVILSGVVAYAADTIAKKVGRKHMRWFGLRPKTTALLVAILAGMGISAASLGAFVLLNKNAIDTIAAADQLRPQLDALRKEIRGVQGDLKAANQEKDAAQAEAKRLSDLQAQAQRDLESTRTDLKAARDAETKLKAEAATLSGKVQQLSANIKTLEGRAKANVLKLQQSETALKSSRARAQALDAQVVELNTRVALSAQETRTAQDRAQAAQVQAEQAQARARAAQAQARAQATQAQQLAAQAQAKANQQSQAAQAQAKAAQQQAQAAQAQAQALKGQLVGLQGSRQQAVAALRAAQQAMAQALAQQRAAQQARDRLAQERDKLAADRDKIAADRDQAAKERDRVRDDLDALQQQQLQLKSSNDALARDLAAARASLGKLQDEYSSSRAELSASRNTDLAYPKNDLVYAAVVPSVRNLDKFLIDAAGAAQAKGSRGTPAARLNADARAFLETKLRGLNAATFVQCRAAQNSAVGFPVDLSCDARANNVLYKGNQVIRRINVNLKSDPRVIQEQISELVKDTVTDITARGVPDEYIMNQGLDVTEFVNLLATLNARTGSSAVVGLAARQDVKPSSRVDLYAVVQ